MKIVARRHVFDRFPRPLVAVPPRGPGFHACAGEPRDECGAVVVAAGTALAEGHATKLGRPDQQCVIEQAALLEVGEQGGGGLVHAAGNGTETACDIAMIVPISRGTALAAINAAERASTSLDV